MCISFAAALHALARSRVSTKRSPPPLGSSASPIPFLHSSANTALKPPPRLAPSLLLPQRCSAHHCTQRRAAPGTPPLRHEPQVAAPAPRGALGVHSSADCIYALLHVPPYAFPLTNTRRSGRPGLHCRRPMPPADYSVWMRPPLSSPDPSSGSAMVRTTPPLPPPLCLGGTHDSGRGGERHCGCKKEGLTEEGKRGTPVR